MGAGLSGLACALTLEKHGITPTVFEAMLSIFSKPIMDCIAYLSDKHGIYLHPTGNIEKMILHSKNQKAEIVGQLGFTNIRGRQQDSFDQQLCRELKTSIIYNSKETYEQLLQDYTHVILATGDGAYSEKIHNYDTALSVTIKGATLEGAFDRYTAMAWLDYEYAPKGYAYLLPFSEKEATIALALPDYPENKLLDIDLLWDKFYQRVSKDTNQFLRITDQFHIADYAIGMCRAPRIGNTFFVGNCFGSIMPFLGFGQFVALCTGIFAAHDLAGIGNYEALTLPFRKSFKNSMVLRKALEQRSNTDLDCIIKFMNSYWGSYLGNKIINSKRIDPLRITSLLLRPFITTKEIKDI